MKNLLQAAALMSLSFAAAAQTQLSPLFDRPPIGISEPVTPRLNLDTAKSMIRYDFVQPFVVNIKLQQEPTSGASHIDVDPFLDDAFIAACRRQPSASRCPNEYETSNWLNMELAKTMQDPFVLSKDRLLTAGDVQYPKDSPRQVINWGVTNLPHVTAITLGIGSDIGFQGTVQTLIGYHSSIEFYSPDWQNCKKVVEDCTPKHPSEGGIRLPEETDWDEVRHIYNAFRYLASIEGAHLAPEESKSSIRAASFQEALQMQLAEDRREAAQRAAEEDSSQTDVDAMRREQSSRLAKSPSLLGAIVDGLQQASDDLAQQNAAQQPRTDAGWQAAQDLVNANETRRAAAAAAQQRKNSGSSTLGGVCPNGKLVDDAAQCDCRAHSANGVYSCPR